MSETQPPVYRWVVLSTWMTAHVLGFAIITVIGILLPSISEEMSLSSNQQGLLGSSAQWGNILLAVPLALWASRILLLWRIGPTGCDNREARLSPPRGQIARHGAGY